MGQIACIDCCILIWGIQKVAPDGRKEKVDQTLNLLDRLLLEHASVIVPSVILGEFLVRIPTIEHEENIHLIQKSFKIYPVDTNVAVHYARIWNKHHQDDRDPDCTRVKMKIDFLVVAIAVANKADVIYSEDPHIKKFAAGFVDVEDVPVINYQLPLGINLLK